MISFHDFLVILFGALASFGAYKGIIAICVWTDKRTPTNLEESLRKSLPERIRAHEAFAARKLDQRQQHQRNVSGRIRNELWPLMLSWKKKTGRDSVTGDLTNSESGWTEIVLRDRPKMIVTIQMNFSKDQQIRVVFDELPPIYLLDSEKDFNVMILEVKLAIETYFAAHP